MVRCVCTVCGRVVNGRVPALDIRVFPYRHLPPGELGRGSYRHEDGTTSWFGHERWCSGSWEVATIPPKLLCESHPEAEPEAHLLSNDGPDAPIGAWNCSTCSKKLAPLYGHAHVQGPSGKIHKSPA